MSQGEEQLDSEIVFFVDRSLGGMIVPDAIRAAGYLAEAHDDHFGPATADEEWLPEVGKRGWVVITKDRRFKSRTPELVAMIRANTHVFVLRDKKLNGDEQAQAIVKAIPDILNVIRSHSPPVMGTFSVSGLAVEVEGVDLLIQRLLKS